MASSLETNKLLAAVLTAGIIASGSGVVSNILYSPSVPEELAYPIEVAAEDGEAAEEEQVEPLPVRLANADPAAGEGTARPCAACHTFEAGGANGVGPNLHGVVGREIAAVEGFGYSDALAGTDGAWDYEALDGFLADPRGWASGTSMTFAGVGDPEARADLILYLRSITDDPPALPEPEEEVVAATEEQPAAEEEAGAEEQPAGEQEAGAEEQPADGDQAAAEEEAATAEPEEGAAPAGDEFTQLIAEADPGAGEQAARACAACHSFEEGGPNKIGPNLHGIVGQDIAAVEGFSYSDALSGLEGTWDYEALSDYLADPRGYAPGTRMAFAGLKDDQQRAQVIAYLRSLTENPPPLPGEG